MNESAKVLMTHKEARDCVEKIRAGMNNIRALVVDLHDREGWSALGYESWTECIEKEFEQGRRYIFYQFRAAQVEQNINDFAKNKCTMVHLGTIPERQLRPLAKLPPRQQREAWQQAVETAPQGKVTAYHVQKVVSKIIGEEKDTREKNMLTKPVNEEALGLEFQRAWDQLFVVVKKLKASKWKIMSKNLARQRVQILIDIIEV